MRSRSRAGAPGDNRERPRRRRLPRMAGALGLAAAFVVLLASPAWAHAQLLNTSPAGDTVLKTSPKQVELTFGENVEISFGSIALFDQTGGRVDIGAPHHAPTSDHSVEASLPNLKNGAYVVTWRVISADSHPVHGAFTFTIGSSSVNAEGLAAKLEAHSGGSETVGVVFGIARTLLFAGIALLLGALAFATAIRPRGPRRSRADSLVWVGWITVFVATIAGVLLQGPYAGGLAITETFHSAVVRAVLQTRYGHLAEIRLLLVLALLPLLFVVRKHWRPAWWWWFLATPLAVAIAATPGLAGHAATGTFTQLAIPADTLHVTAMSIWLGGLAALAFVVIDREPDAGRTARRFSPVALTSVLVIVATGLFAAWRQAGLTFDAYIDTSYGRLLIVKVGIFVLLLGLAGLSRRIVRAPRPATLSAMVIDAPPETGVSDTPTDHHMRHLRWTVVGELVFGIAVLTVTAMLVNAQPARSALALPLSKEIRTSTTSIDIIIDPAKAGPVQIHIYTLSPGGGNVYAFDITAELSLPSKGIAPLTVPLVRAGPNHFKANSFAIPFPGKWLLVIRAERDQFDEVAVQTFVNIR